MGGGGADDGDRDWHAAAELVATSWGAERSGIVRLLCEHDGLNRQSYRRPTIEEKCAPSMDEELALGRPGISIRFKNFQIALNILSLT